MYTYIDPSKNNYPGLDRGFNQRYKLDGDLTEADKEGVYLVYNASDILSALNEIVTPQTFDSLSGKIRMISGGHCYEDFTFQGQAGNPNGTRYVIDVSNMRGIYEETIDTTTYVVVEPGASNWLIQQTLHSTYGAALPGGSCYSVCAGGHIAGGGYGLLSRLHGLTVDYLAGVEMVIPDGAGGFTLRTFDPADNDLLNWASRGGGAGHFGIITKYYFEKTKLPLAPENALFITLPVPWSQFINVDDGSVDNDNFNNFMQAYFVACEGMEPQGFTLGKFTYMASADDVMSIAMQVVYGPSSGHDASLGGNTIASITKAEALDIINTFTDALSSWVSAPGTSGYHKQPFQLLGHPVSGSVSLDMIYDLPWIEMTQFLNGSGENQNGKYKSSYISGNFTSAESSAIAAFLTDTQSDNPSPVDADKSQTLIQIDSYGSQINAMDTNETPQNTAIAARNSNLKTQYQTYWKNFDNTTDPDTREANIVTWFNAGYNAIHNAAQGDVENSGYPLWSSKYQGCYFNYPDRQIGVNSGYKQDPGGNTFSGDFSELYFGVDVAARLKWVKENIDPNNFFAFAQSIPLSVN
ncbi:FAD-binding protein [Rahnella bruchi]|uniref:FAD-binding protein n=1 Tax=Rahnella bruchi TaxID=1510573 RepID=UPI0013C3F511|nr:FAD-binding protein [Rahnella bruchi]